MYIGIGSLYSMKDSEDSAEAEYFGKKTPLTKQQILELKAPSLP